MQLAGVNKIKLSLTFDCIVKVGTISIPSLRDAGTVERSIVSLKHCGGVEAGPRSSLYKTRANGLELPKRICYKNAFIRFA